jgi:hypothetical protein
VALISIDCSVEVPRHIVPISARRDAPFHVSPKEIEAFFAWIRCSMDFIASPIYTCSRSFSYSGCQLRIASFNVTFRAGYAAEQISSSLFRRVNKDLKTPTPILNKDAHVSVNQASIKLCKKTRC